MVYNNNNNNSYDNVFKGIKQFPPKSERVDTLDAYTLTTLDRQGMRSQKRLSDTFKSH